VAIGLLEIALGEVSEHVSRLAIRGAIGLDLALGESLVAAAAGLGPRFKKPEVSNFAQTPAVYGRNPQEDFQKGRGTTGAVSCATRDATA
jgi:hypothetical protein